MNQPDNSHIDTQNIIAVFNLVAPNYDNPSQRYFPFCADRLVSRLQPHRGHKILDIATGTGMATVAAAPAVAPDGRVHAIDLAERMLDKAQVNIQKTGLTNVDFHVMDGASLDFKSRYFDSVMCSFGLFFMPDMLAALKEWRRVLKPGGSLLFTSFGKTAFQPMADLFREHLQQFGIDVPTTVNFQRLTQADKCQDLLLSAGFTEVSVQHEQMGHHLRNQEDWWEILNSSGFRGMLEQLSSQQLNEFRQTHLTEVAKLVNDKGLWLDVDTLFSFGRRLTES